MNVNGISESVSSYTNKTTTTPKKTTEKQDTKSAASNSAPKDTYTPSDTTKNENSTKKIYKQDTALVAKLKAEAESRSASLRSLVEKMMLDQGHQVTNANDMFRLLREGKLNVDPAVAKQAQADIAEDGYWGVDQTSERLFSFAQALTGGNPAKAELMKDAMIKGFEAAKKAWGGELPEICQKTYDAAIKKFDEWTGTTTE